MTYWPKSREACLNCGALHRPHYGGRGYCCRCYRAVRRIEGVKRWDTAGVKRQEQPNDEEFDIFQAEYIDQLDSCLVWLPPREDGYRGNVRAVRFRP